MSKLQIESSVVHSLAKKGVWYRRIFCTLTGNVKSALMLSQIYFWQDLVNEKEENGWWYKTDKDWMNEIGFTEHEIKSSRKRLLELNILEVKKLGLPARNFYRLNLIALNKALSELKTDALDSGKITDQSGENHLTNTYNTTENTTENKTLLKTSFSEKKAKSSFGIKPGKKLKKGSVIMGAEEVLENFKPVESIEEIMADIKGKKKKTYTASLLSEYWKRVYRYYYPKLPAHEEISYGKQARLRNIFQKIEGIDILESIAIIMGNWPRFIKHCDVAHGIKYPTDYPTIVFLEKARMAIVTFCEEHKKELQEPEIHFPEGMEHLADEFGK